MTTIVLVRHGETDWNREGRYQGSRDIPLNARGSRQAVLLGQGLSAFRFTAAVASPLARAAQTAGHALAGRNVALRTDPRLQEIGHGEWEGLLKTEVEQRWPELWQHWRRAPHEVTMPGGESLAQVQQRACAVLAEIAAAQPAGVVLMAAHDATNRTLLLHALGAPLSRFWCLKQDPTCVNVLQHAVGAWRVVALNSVAHLGGLLSGEEHRAV